MSLVEAGTDLIIGMDYIHLTDDDLGTNLPIMLLTGDYKGVVIEYNSVAFLEGEDDDSCILQFDYNIIKCEGFEKDKLKIDPKFKQNIGDVLRSIINIMVDRGDFGESENRTDNSTGTDSE